MKNHVQLGLLILTCTALIVLGYNIYLSETIPPSRSYSSFLEELHQGHLVHIHLRGGQITAEDNTGRIFNSFSPDVSSLMPQILEQELSITAAPAEESPLVVLFKSTFPFLLLLAAWLIFNKKQSTGSALSDFKRQAYFSVEKTKRVTFKDVAGIEEAKVELQEIVAFLRHPEKFNKLGGKIPKGVLLQGPPGTGKTLLAKAIASEADVAFYSLSGSDFVEMFVGVGASRVRDLFAEAKKNSPCIIFIDEIDAIGARRSSNSSNSSDERDQTLNALLVELDGFSSTTTVILVGATNRPDILDPALMRPGRLDRQITIALPDLKGRQKILKVHSSQITTSPDVNLMQIAQSIPGFSGAEIANLVNEAALMAARHDKSMVETSDFEEAKDKIIMGIESKSLAINEQDRRMIAYHEAGHAIVGLLLEETDPIHKITIIPRGRAMGLTQQLPVDDRLTHSREYLLNRIKTLLGGRAAESLVFNRLTTGASNDITAATEIATKIVCDWGMSDEIGPISCRHTADGTAYDDIIHPSRGSIGQQVDLEIRRIIKECYEESYTLLKTHNKFLHIFAEALLIHETMDAKEVDIVHRSYLKELDMKQALSATDVALNPFKACHGSPADRSSSQSN